MPRLPRVLSDADLPYPELCAARLDGELARVGEMFCAIDEPDSIVVRATSLGMSWPNRYIAERRSAAWVWGALYSPPAIHDLCASLGARTRPQVGSRVHMREVAIGEDDIVDIGGLLVTNPLRTVTDLARCASVSGAEATMMIRNLCVSFDITLEHCQSALHRKRNLPNITLARSRLTQSFASTPAQPLPR